MSLPESIKEAIVSFAEWLCGPLVPAGVALKNLMVHMPLWVVRVFIAAALLALMIWCLTLAKSYVMEEARRATWWNDPRRWAAAVLLIQVALYLCL
jgi:multisubunit Na+/H+ antiporter MnhE subunit